MKDLEIELLGRAVDAFSEIGDIQINIQHYSSNDPSFDAMGALIAERIEIPLVIEVKAHLNPVIIRLKKPMVNGKQVLLVANYVTPLFAEKLKEQAIWFIDAAGNAYVNCAPIYIYVKGNKPTEKPVKRTGIAFNVAGLKVVYALLCKPELANAPYREIAQKTGVSLGLIGLAMADLTKLGFIIDMGSKGRRLRHKRNLLERWVIAYPEKLRPKLEIGRYQAPTPDWWQVTNLKDFNAYWGCEAAANKLTHYLKPGLLTVYLPEQQKAKFIIHNKLRKESAGAVELLNIFWNVNENPINNTLVNPILIYADLMASSDPRNIETAQLIYDQELAGHFRED